jgi:hypothetical protein
VPESCLVGVQLATSIVRALEVRISDASDVYVDYSMAGSSGAHISYHASGQRHTKRGREYAFQFIGSSGVHNPSNISSRDPSRSEAGRM